MKLPAFAPTQPSSATLHFLTRMCYYIKIAFLPLEINIEKEEEEEVPGILVHRAKIQILVFNMNQYKINFARKVRFLARKFNG